MFEYWCLYDRCSGSTTKALDSSGIVEYEVVGRLSAATDDSGVDSFGMLGMYAISY